MLEKLEFGVEQDRSGVGCVEPVSGKDDWRTEEKAMEANDGTEDGGGIGRKISGRRSGGIGKRARGIVGRENTRVGRVRRRDGSNGGNTGETGGEYGGVKAANGWRSRKVKPTKVGEESVVG